MWPGCTGGLAPVLFAWGDLLQLPVVESSKVSCRRTTLSIAFGKMHAGYENINVFVGRMTP